MSTRSRPTRGGLAVLTAALLTLAAACATTSTPTRPPAEPGPRRGAPVTVTPVATLDAGQARAHLKPAGLGSRARFGVQASRVVYRTVDPAGRPTTASALVALPDNRDQDIRIVAWLHGTTVHRGEVASVNPDSFDRRIAFTFAAAGYAVAAPDYLGLGSGPGAHPFRDPSSEVTASLDALRAAQALAERDGRRLDRQVLVAGHSQGGAAAMALGRALQDGGDPRLGLAAVAPISGPYDTSGTLRTALDGRINLATGYLAYLAVAWNRLHGLYGTPGEAFRAPYDTTLAPLFDNDHTPQQILPRLPATPEELFTPAFLERLRHPSGALAEQLQETDGICRWQPRVPVDLFAASGDRDVPIANAHHCLRELRASGGAARLVDVGEVDHAESALRSVPRALDRFDTLGG